MLARGRSRGRGACRNEGRGRVQNGGRGQGSAAPGQRVVEVQMEQEQHPDNLLSYLTVLVTQMQMSGLILMRYAKFDNSHTVSTRVTEAIKTYYNGPWTSFSNLPDGTAEIWFRNFKHYYKWDSCVAEAVKKEFMAKAKVNLRRAASRLGKETDPAKTTWCASNVRQQLLEHRASENFKVKSEKCSESRTVGDKARTTDAQGSISSLQLQEEMTKKLKREVTAAELFKRSHMTSGGKFVDEQAKKVWEKYEGLKTTNPDSVIQAEDDNDTFYKAVGGWNKKRRLYGLGAAAEYYYEKPAVSKKRRMNNPNLEKKIESQQQQIQDLVALVEKLTQSSAGCNSHRSPPPPSPPPSSPPPNQQALPT